MYLEKKNSIKFYMMDIYIYIFFMIKLWTLYRIPSVQLCILVLLPALLCLDLTSTCLILPILNSRWLVVL